MEENIKKTSFIHADRKELKAMLEAFLLGKAFYELGYELNNCPEWVIIRLKEIKELLKGE